MSVQNNLKKPEFTKTMLGYTPKEVDQYIDHILERYAAVSRDVTELKRRVTRLQLGLESGNYPSETPEAAKTESAPVYNGLSDSVMDKLRHMIESERRRHEEAMDALMSFLEAHSRDEELPTPAEDFIPEMSETEIFPEDISFETPVEDTVELDESDAEWENILEAFISDVPAEETLAEKANEDDLDLIFDMPLTDEIPSLPDDDEDISHIDLSEEIFEEKEAEIPASEPSSEEKKKTPAEIAAELDFYSDGSVHNGESYDPMTLAAKATMKRRPTLEDFMRPLPENGKNADK